MDIKKKKGKKKCDTSNYAKHRADTFPSFHFFQDEILTKENIYHTISFQRNKNNKSYREILNGYFIE